MTVPSSTAVLINVAKTQIKSLPNQEPDDAMLEGLQTCCIATSFLLCKNDHSFRFFCECLSDKKTLVACFENSGVVGADTVM